MKNNKNAIIVLVVLAVLLVGGYVVAKNKQNKIPEAVVENPAEVSPNNTETPATPLAPVVKLTAWEVFQQYLGYLKNHDIEKVKTVVSQTLLDSNPSCPLRQVGVGKKCNDLMDMAYTEGVKLAKATFVNNMEDGKQVVLSTNYAKKTATEPNTENYGKYYLFFTKGADGNPKFLNMYGIVTTFIYKDLAKATTEEKSARVTKSFTDADKDGLLDRNENCASTKNVVASPYNYQCSSTSPAKRDSLGDGWWDGVRAFIPHK